MKRVICMLLLSTVYVVSYAQPNVPNGDFEIWVDKDYFELSSWTAQGNVKQTTDAYSGSKAIKLSNIASTRSKGIISSGNLAPGKLEGFPYDEQPLSVRFWAKYDLALGDQAEVTVIFTYKGNPLAYCTQTIEGSSADTFRRFSIPITWQVSSNPDSVGIAITSLDLDVNQYNGDGYIIIDDFHFASISTRNKAVPNGDFEDWDTRKNPRLASWYTTDNYLFDDLGITADPPIVAKTAKGRSGSLGIELSNQRFGNDIVPGVMFTGDKFSKLDNPAFPINRRWKYLEGYYMYKPVLGDSAFVLVALYKNGVRIGGQSYFITNTTSSYTYFATELQYFNNDVPDSAYVMISCANPENPHSDGTSLLVDDVKFSDHNSGVYDLSVNRLTVYPNPCHDFIKLSGTRQMTGSQYQLVDMLGNPVIRGTIIHDLIIDMSDQTPGVYVLHLKGKHVNTSKILIKE